MLSWLKSTLRKYFIERGCEEVIPPDGIDDVESLLLFRDANNMIAVKVVDVSGMPTSRVKDTIMRAVISMRNLAENYELDINKLYVATNAPKIGVLPKFSWIKGLGVGILLVDKSNMKVLEKLPATPRRSQYGKYHAKNLSNLVKSHEIIIKRLEVVEHKTEQLEKTITSIKQELELLRKTISNLKKQLKSPTKIATVRPEEISKASSSDIIDDKDLPSYARNNPWLLENPWRKRLNEQAEDGVVK